MNDARNMRSLGPSRGSNARLPDVLDSPTAQEEKGRPTRPPVPHSLGTGGLGSTRGALTPRLRPRLDGGQ